MRSSDPKSTSRARQFRRDATAAENKLWSALRNRQIDGCKFVRQEPVGPYFADFICRARKLIIEIDGETHETPEEHNHDARRTSYLNQLGYRVIRFTNADVYESMDHVIDTLRGALAASPLTLPPR
ncbi:MAG: endonuclease domain-containing protein [Aestuariivirga sp.]